MKIKIHHIEAIPIVVIMILMMTGFAMAQGGNAIPTDEVITFTVDSYGDFEITRHVGYDGTILSGYVLVASPDLSFTVNFTERETYRPSVYAADSLHTTGFSFNGSTLRSYAPEDSVVDISSLPPDAMAIWRNAMAVATELNNTPEFWDFLDAGPGEDTAKAQFAQFGDGYHFPTLYSERIRLSQVAAQINHGGIRLGRGYQLLVPNQIMILTPDSPGTENPSIFVTMMGDEIFSDYGEFFFDPETETLVFSDISPAEISRVELWERSQDDGFTIAIEEPERKLTELTDILSFFRTQIPSYIDAGILEEDNELELFITKILEWSESFEREVIEPTPVPADFMN